MGAYLRLTPATRAVLVELVSGRPETWGLQLARQTGRPTGTVYPLLDRLEREGFVCSRWDDSPTASGARRRLYTLTPEGRIWASARLSSSKANNALPREGDVR